MIKKNAIASKINKQKNEFDNIFTDNQVSLSIRATNSLC